MLMKPGKDHPELSKMLHESRMWWETATPEQKEDMLKAQRESWGRSMMPTDSKSEQINKAEHTVLPWTLNGCTIEGPHGLRIVQTFSEAISVDEAKANAAFISRAVTNYYPMLAVLRDVMLTLTLIDPGSLSVDRKMVIGSRIRQIREVINSIDGESI